jgi:anti-sigma-K factor RskA
MNIVRDDDREFRDDELHASLRGVYAAPAEESYWASLERRIMARIQTESAREWWSYFPGWVRSGLVAASIAVLVAGYAAWRTREAQEETAYRELLDTPSELPILTESARTAPNARTREATLRYLLSR